jgi:hypothetical protein
MERTARIMDSEAARWVSQCEFKEVFRPTSGCTLLFRIIEFPDHVPVRSEGDHFLWQHE